MSSPADIEPGPIGDELRVAAQVIEMLLISDYSRMEDADTRYDSTHAQQGRFLLISHHEATEEFRRTATEPLDEA